MSQAERFLTHSVDNQVPPPPALNLYRSDLVLREAINREGGGWGEADLAAYGAIAGGELMELGFQANENKPKAKLFDRYGHRLDEVEFHPAYHRIMALGLKHGVAGYAWRHAGKPGAHVARAGLAYLHNQADQGTSCPLTMTYACVAALQHEPALAKDWVPRVAGADYDPLVKPALAKSTLTIGMGMTEKQGGSDVRANTTKAFAQADGTYEIVGHKWFFSAPMCDAWLVLAYTESGITCFLAPKMKPDGARNAIRVQRLKDKLGDWSNASSEVEFQGAWAERVGPEGRGIATILEMVALTRLDCMIGSASLMRQALVQALHHASHRKAFGKRLIEQPLMRNVLADLALESEAATALTFRVARAVDAGERDPHEAAMARLATALGKYWICKRAPAFVNEAQECLGGAGYVEESNLPRLYRQAPLNSIWEGSGNIQCLDVLRALSREPETREAYLTELAALRGAHPDYDRELNWLAHAFDDPASLELRARHVVERMTLALQASILLRGGDPAVAELFCRTRLAGQQGLAFGTLPADSPFETLLARALPAVA
ncbi:isovaleryl-CoA dehydrogenase [Stagnimonas aquatica]|uniref:Isovaleryl-CoA dehydrogenase n=1 Tax=Stagnimonas aquatica TaxID=2689987 RepID=A0A3N0V0A6_9GAMM|nr:isovaleryl-CoA dehydrogenase [Stagnimonas aquatica]ROH85941.1 isovaleryl-CoA dehydrogenase [Stagnimonas aquatica]